MKRTHRSSIVLAAVLASQGIPNVGAAGPDGCTAPATDQDELSSADAWAVFDGCGDDPPSPPEAERDFDRVWARMKQCDEAARAIVRGGTDADRERLWSSFDERPHEQWIGASILDAFLDRHLERALAALEGSASPPRQLPLADVEMPEFLRDAPADLQQAWQTYQSVIQAQEEAGDLPSRGAEIPFTSNQVAFRRAIAGLLQGRVPPAEAVRELSRYQWEGGCGMAGGLLYVPQAKALVIAHLQGGRTDLALVASGGIGASPFRFEEPRARWDRRLLAAAGVDWEELYLGGALSRVTEMADTLAREGSERAGRHLLAAAQVMETDPEHESNALLWPLAALVESRGPCGDYRTADPSEVQRNCGAEPVSGDLQEDILDRLAEKAGPDAGLGEAGVASHLLVRLCRAESRPAFRAMLRSRYEQVRERGAVGLRAHGETVADPRPSRPVVFRILVDGKPAAEQKVEWMLESAEQDHEWSSTSSDDQGIVRLGRDPFVDPTDHVTSMRLATPDLASATDVWFAASLETPADLDAVSTLSVHTGSLTVVIPPALLAGKRPPPRLQLIARTADDGDDAVRLFVGLKPPVVSARITFPHLQQGEYEVWLTRGDSLHASPTVAVGERPATVTVNETPVGEEPED